MGAGVSKTETAIIEQGSPPDIHVVGIGLAGLDSLSPASLALVRSATLLIGSTRHLEAIACGLANAESLPDMWPLGQISEVFESLRSHLSNDPETRTVILATGDPLFFGLGRLLLAHFAPQQLIFHPQLSSIQLAFSRLKVPWQDATLISVHGRGEALLVQAVKRGDAKIAILTDGVLTPSAIAALIASLDLPVHYQQWVCENLGDVTENVSLYSPTLASSTEQAKTYAPLNVVVLLRLDQANETSANHSLQALPLIGLPDGVFRGFPDRPTLMTKREVRLLILGAIAPLDHQVIWDIGAGTGSISVELSRLCPSAQIFAIEKTAIGASLIRTNAEKLAIAPITVIQGQAPLALQGLPTPNRVFIGGSSHQLGLILSLLDGLSPTLEKIVLALATLEHLNEVTQWANRPDTLEKWRCQLTQINISRSCPVGPFTRFSPLNPVTLVAIESI